MKLIMHANDPDFRKCICAESVVDHQRLYVLAVTAIMAVEVESGQRCGTWAFEEPDADEIDGDFQVGEVGDEVEDEV